MGVTAFKSDVMICLWPHSACSAPWSSTPSLQHSISLALSAVSSSLTRVEAAALSQELAELAGTQFLQHTLRQRQTMTEEYSKKLEPIFMKNATKFPTARFNLPRCVSIQYCLSSRTNAEGRLLTSQ